MPVIAFLGTDDPLVPFQGGKVTGPFGRGNRGLVVSAATLEEFWAKCDGCEMPPRVKALPGVAGGDGSSVSLHAYDGCEGSSGASVCIIDGGGHTWPGGKQYLAPLLVGKTNRAVSASELIWSFFSLRTLP